MSKHSTATWLVRMASAFLCLSEVAFAQELVSEQRVSFRVTYDNNDVDNMVAKYAAYAQDDSHNTGSASHGIGHLQDTRRCVMSMASWIQRDVCIASRATGDVCKGEYSRVFHDGRKGGTQSQNLFSGRLSAKTCGDVRSTLVRNYGALKANVASTMNSVISSDLEELFATIRAKQGVAKVERK